MKCLGIKKCIKFIDSNGKPIYVMNGQTVNILVRHKTVFTTYTGYIYDFNDSKVKLIDNFNSSISIDTDMIDRIEIVEGELL